MKKLFLSILFVGGLFIGLSSISKAADVKSWNYTETTSSATIFNGGGYVKKVYLSHCAPSAEGTHYAVLVDSVVAAAGSTFSIFPASQKKSPALLFNSTTTLLSTGANGYDKNASIVYDDPGLYIEDAAYLYQTAVASGETYKCGVLWRK